jgi:hypothetical protein
MNSNIHIYENCEYCIKWFIMIWYLFLENNNFTTSDVIIDIININTIIILIHHEYFSSTVNHICHSTFSNVTGVCHNTFYQTIVVYYVV